MQCAGCPQQRKLTDAAGSLLPQCNVRPPVSATIAFRPNPNPPPCSPRYPDTFLSSPILPIILAVLTGFVIAQVFFAVYEMAIDTVMLSFCEDCEANNGTPAYAPPLLMEVMNAAYPADGK